MIDKIKTDLIHLLKEYDTLTSTKDIESLIDRYVDIINLRIENHKLLSDVNEDRIKNIINQNRI